MEGLSLHQRHSAFLGVPGRGYGTRWMGSCSPELGSWVGRWSRGRLPAAAAPACSREHCRLYPWAQRKGCPFPNCVCFSQGPLFPVARRPGPSGVTRETGAWVFGFRSGTMTSAEWDGVPGTSSVICHTTVVPNDCGDMGHCGRRWAGVGWDGERAQDGADC